MVVLIGICTLECNNPETEKSHIAHLLKNCSSQIGASFASYNMNEYFYCFKLDTVFSKITI